MTDLVWEDSHARHLIHSVINCIQALSGYCELGELDKAIAISYECSGNIAELRIELQKMRDELKNT